MGLDLPCRLLSLLEYSINGVNMVNNGPRESPSQITFMPLNVSSSTIFQWLLTIAV